MGDLLIINERGPDFWNPYSLADETGYACLNSGGDETPLSEQDFNQHLKKLQDKKILVLIHGLKSLRDQVVTNYNHASHNITELTNNDSQSVIAKIQRFFSTYIGLWEPEKKAPYDGIIGISWPSYDHEMYYYQAKQNAIKVAPKVAMHLHQISQVASHVDILAHSMGNFLLFESLLDPNARHIKLNHIYSLAAAVPRNEMSLGQRYGEVAQKCKRIFTLYSKHDTALQWPFYLAEGGQTALGLRGVNMDQPIANNVTSVDCSDFAKHHSAYLRAPELYRFVETNHNHELPYFELSNHLQIATTDQRS